MEDAERNIRTAVENYVTGFNRGDKELLQQALHPRFVSSGFFQGELQWDSAEEFAAFCAEAAPDPDGPVPEWTIETLVISRQTAVAIVRDSWGSRQFRDSLTLLEDNGRWQIVFKAFHGLE
jgi:hypothetical protein